MSNNNEYQLYPTSAWSHCITVYANLIEQSLTEQKHQSAIIPEADWHCLSQCQRHYTIVVEAVLGVQFSIER